MSELSEGSRPTTSRRGKITGSHRQPAPLSAADQVQASKRRIATGLANLFTSLSQDENLFGERNDGQATVLHGPFGVTLILCLSDACQKAARETELNVSFRIDDRESHSRPESTLIETLRMTPSLTAEGDIAWSCPAAPNHPRNEEEVVSLLAEKLANYILRRLKRACRPPGKESLKKTLKLFARQPQAPPNPSSRI